MADDKLPSDYDAIVLGTGMTECIIAAALARNGLQVLHLDRNDYYSGDWATFHFEALQKWISRKQGKVKDNLTPPDCDLPSLLEEEESLVPLELSSNSVANVSEHVYISESNPADDHVEEGKEREGNAASKPEDVQDGGTQFPTVQGQFDGPEEENGTEEKLKAEKSADEGEENSKLENQFSNLKVQDKEETKEVKKIWTLEELKKQWRKFNIDLTPRVLYARGSMVELLISSDIAKYCEFKTVTRVLTNLNDKLEQVPCSRSDVFSSKQVSMIEKRMLMKLLTFCLEYDQHPHEYAGFEEKTFEEFLGSKKLTANVKHYVLRAIAMATDKTSTLEGLKSTQKFLQSLGRYGNTAFLWPLYGSGELPQCFCRMCAVFGGIYCLRRTAVSMIKDKEGKCKGIVDTEGQRLNAKWLVMDASYASDQLLPKTTKKRFTSRAVLITDKSVLPSDTEHITLLSLPPGPGQSVPTTVFELAPMSMACPKGLFVVLLVAEGVTTAEMDLKPVVDLLFQPKTDEEQPETDSRPHVLWALYYDQMDTASPLLGSSAPDNVFIVAGPDNNLDFECSISEARRIFDLICPGDEFLPKAPNPEDIIWGDEGQEGQGSGFEGGDMEDAEGDKNTEDGVTEAKPEADESGDPGVAEAPSDSKSDLSTDVSMTTSGTEEVAASSAKTTDSPESQTADTAESKIGDQSPPKTAD